MDIIKYIIIFLLILVNFVLGIANIECGSYYIAALNFTGIGFIAGMTAAAIIDDIY